MKAKRKPSERELFSQRLLRYIAKERKAWDKIRINFPDEGAGRALQALRGVAAEVRILRGKP